MVLPLEKEGGSRWNLNLARFAGVKKLVLRRLLLATIKTSSFLQDVMIAEQGQNYFVTAIRQRRHGTEGQTMYDELVKRLRKLSGTDNLSEFDEAADAIESMSEAYDKLSRHMDDLAALMPRWIPVSERLPEQKATIGKHVFSADVLGTEGFTFRRAYYNYTAKVWLDGNEKQEWPEITHWMPLPEPPKEE
jgi:hypothetical protein